MIGTTISHYRIEEVIGRGGMGVVYRAEDLRLHRSVALKFLPPDVAADASVLERFRREATAASSLNHPGICTIHDIDEHDSTPFIVMELLEGETLHDRIRRGVIGIGEIVEWGSQIADALDVAHSRGIIHPDVKPANIFITRRGQAKLLDTRSRSSGNDDRRSPSDRSSFPRALRGGCRGCRCRDRDGRIRFVELRQP